MKNLCKQNWYQITLLFLFCVTVFLRFYKLTVLPDVLHIDEAALGYNSWCLANYGTDRYLNVLPFYPQNFYGGQSPLYTYLVVLLIKFFGKGNLSVFLVRFPAAFASLLLWITGTRSMSLIFDNKKITLGAARIKQHKNVFRKRRSFGYAVSPFCRSISKDAGSIPTRS